MPFISGVIIAYNEEKYIARCIRSMQGVVDEIVVVDSLSSDKTPEICRSLGAKLIQQPFLGYIEQKNFALKEATYDYVLSLDADEALSESLAASIKEVRQKWLYDSYRFNRMNRFCGKWMRYTNYYPDRKLRLFDRRKGRWGGVNPHDRVVMEKGATTGFLTGDLLHWMCDSLQEHMDTINRYSGIAAMEAFKNGVRCPVWKVWYKPLWRFFQYYVVKRGFLDGYMGLVVSRHAAFMCFQKYARLRCLLLESRRKTEDGRRKVEGGR